MSQPAPGDPLPDFDTARATRVRWCVDAWLSAAAAIAYISRTSLAVAEEDIRTAIGINEDQMGLVMGPAFFWTYALAQIPTAWLGQRYGSRSMLVLFTAACSASVLMFGLADSLAMLLLARMAMGISQAGLFPCSTQTIAKWHPSTERAIASGWLGGAMQGGHGIAMAVTGVLIVQVGWRPTFLLFALPGLLWAVGFGGWFRNDPREHASVNDAERRLILGNGQGPEPDGECIQQHHAPWGKLLTSGTMWLICAQQFFRAGGHVFYASWFATYLRETRGVSLQQSAWMTAAPVMAFMFAAFLGGGISDFILVKTGNLNAARNGVAIVSLVLCTVTMAAAWLVENPLVAVLMISTAIFFSGFAGPVSYALTIDVGGRHVPAVFSTMNMFGNFGAGLLAWLVPHFRAAVERLAGDSADAVRTSWDAVLLFFAAAYLIAAACWIWLRIEPDLLDRE